MSDMFHDKRIVDFLPVLLVHTGFVLERSVDVFAVTRELEKFSHS